MLDLQKPGDCCHQQPPTLHKMTQLCTEDCKLRFVENKLEGEIDPAYRVTIGLHVHWTGWDSSGFQLASQCLSPVSGTCLEEKQD